MPEYTAIQLDPNRDPWERQPNETAQRHTRFCVYRDLGATRTLRKVAEQLQLHEITVRAMAAAGHWRDRALAYDEHQHQLYDAEFASRRREAAQADAELLDIVMKKVRNYFSEFLNIGTLEPQEAIRLLNVALRYRRLLFGDPTATVAVTGASGGPLQLEIEAFTALAPEERRAELARLSAEAARLAGVLTSDDDE